VKTALLIICMSFILCVSAQEKTISGKVMYMAAGSVYTSLGREAGVVDSLQMVVYRGMDTLAILQLFAMSSKSSVCRILESKESFGVGDSVKAVLPAVSMAQIPPPLHQDTTVLATKEIKHVPQIPIVHPENSSLIKMKGRISVQYNTTQSDFSLQDFQQTGLLFNVHGEATGAPIKFEMYGNVRTTAYGGGGLFSTGSRNDSRVYRMSLEYDDQTNVVGIGRILPLYSSSLGYIDGVRIARRFGMITTGAAIGFQPSIAMQTPSGDNKKVLLFVQYEGTDAWRKIANITYARVWSGAGTEREAVSGFFTMYSPTGFSFYASTETELHTASQGRLNGDPALSLLYGSANYCFSEVVTVGVGTDASRTMYSLDLTKIIPDSLLDRQLRSGVSFNINLSPWRGAGFYDMYTARSANEGFGKEFSNSSSFFISNIQNSGVMVRLNYLLNESEFTRTQGYGMSVQRTFVGIDCGLRFQRYRAVLHQLDIANSSTTIGFDLSALLTSRLILFGSLDRLQTPGTASTSLYLELSERF
jgi:hypothetical protein